VNEDTAYMSGRFVDSRLYLRIAWDYVRRTWPFYSFIVLFVLLVLFTVGQPPPLIDYSDLRDGQMTEAQRQAVGMVTDLNKFLISLITLMFGVVSFYLTHYKDKIVAVFWPWHFLVLMLILLSLCYWFAFRVYAELTSELSQNALALKPGFSYILYNLTLEAVAFGSASVLAFVLFIMVFKMKG